MLELKKPKTTIHKEVERKLNNIVPFERIKVPFILKKAKSAPIVETPDGAVCSGHATMQWRSTDGGSDTETRPDPEND